MRSTSRTARIELFAALLAAASGVVAVLFVLFGPLYAISSETVGSDGRFTQSTSTAGLLQAGLDPVTAVVLTVAVLASMGIGLGAILHLRTGTGAGRGLVAVATVALVVVAILGALSIGIFLLPSIVLGFVAFAAGARPTPSAGAWPHP